MGKEKKKKNEAVEKPDYEENDLLSSDNEIETKSKEEALLQKVGNTMAQTMATMMAKMFEQQMESLKTISKKKNEDSDDQKSPEKSNERSRRTSMPSFSVPKVHKEDLLTGSKNLNKWKNKLAVQLRSLRLEEYILTEYGDPKAELSQERRREHDAQALQVIHATISNAIANLIVKEATAHAAYKKICELFEGNRCSEITLAERRYAKLTFKSHYDPIRFLNEFEQLHQEISGLGATFDQEYLGGRFLSKIEDQDDSTSPYYTFYHQMRVLPPEQRKYEYMKKNFLSVDNSAIRKRKYEPTAREKPAKFAKNDRYDRNRYDRNREQHERDHTKSRTTYQSKSNPTSLTKLYTSDQLAKLKTMTKEEKKEVLCGKCGTYFHKPEKCPYPGKLCYGCYRFGHDKPNCRSSTKD